MTAPDPAAQSDAGDGPVLGEDAVLTALQAYGRRLGYSQMERMRDAIEALTPHVDALLAQARAEEREWIAEMLDRTAGRIDEEHYDEYDPARANAYRRAARIARGTS